jgi:hypothetical protein
MMAAQHEMEQEELENAPTDKKAPAAGKKLRRG